MRRQTGKVPVIQNPSAASCLGFAVGSPIRGRQLGAALRLDVDLAENQPGVVLDLGLDAAEKELIREVDPKRFPSPASDLVLQRDVSLRRRHDESALLPHGLKILHVAEMGFVRSRDERVFVEDQTNESGARVISDPTILDRHVEISLDEPAQRGGQIGIRRRVHPQHDDQPGINNVGDPHRRTAIKWIIRADFATQEWRQNVADAGNQNAPRLRIEISPHFERPTVLFEDHAGVRIQVRGLTLQSAQILAHPGISRPRRRPRCHERLAQPAGGRLQREPTGENQLHRQSRLDSGSHRLTPVVIVLPAIHEPGLDLARDSPDFRSRRDVSDRIIAEGRTLAEDPQVTLPPTLARPLPHAFRRSIGLRIEDEESRLALGFVGPVADGIPEDRIDPRRRLPGADPAGD